MTTPTVRIRLSPSGPFIGTPPQRVGPGSTGVIARAHGAGTPIALTATGYYPIPGMSAVPVDMEPGYLYEVDLKSEVLVTGLSFSGGLYGTYFRLRNKATGTYGAYQPLFNGTHTLPLDPTTNDIQLAFTDDVMALAVTAAVDRVEFSVVGATPNGGHVELLPEGCFGHVTEYMP